MRFNATIQLDGKTATGIRVPEEVVRGLGAGKRFPVLVTIKGHTYRSTVASMGGEYKIPVSSENRQKAGVSAGDQVDVDIALDNQPREVTVPDDLSAALASDDAAARFFEGLTYSQKKAYVFWIEEAKRAETRQQRVTRTVEALRAGRTQR